MSKKKGLSLEKSVLRNQGGEIRSEKDVGLYFETLPQNQKSQMKYKNDVCCFYTRLKICPLQ